MRQGIGTGLEVGAYMAPVGALGAGAKLATKVGQGAVTGAATGLLAASGRSLANAPTNEKVSTSIANAEFSGMKGAGVGAVLGAVVPVVNATVRKIYNSLPRVLGMATQESSKTIETALSNPEAADKAAIAGDDQLRKVIQEGSDKSQELQSNFIKGYTNLRDSLPGYNEPLKNVNKGWIMQSFQDAVKNKGGKILDDGTLYFTGSRVAANPGEVASINRAYDAIKANSDWTFSGVDDLKHTIGANANFADVTGRPAKSAFLGSYYKTLNDTIKRNLPDKVSQAYAEMNDVFANNIGTYNDMVRAFNSGDPFTRLANVLGKNKDTLRKLIEYYDSRTGSAVLPTVAGRQIAMEESAPFGIANPQFWVDMLWSPKTQARFVSKVGEFANKLPVIK